MSPALQNPPDPFTFNPGIPIISHSHPLSVVATDSPLCPLCPHRSSQLHPLLHSTYHLDSTDPSQAGPFRSLPCAPLLPLCPYSPLYQNYRPHLATPISRPPLHCLVSHLKICNSNFHTLRRPTPATLSLSVFFFHSFYGCSYQIRMLSDTSQGN